MFLTFLFGLTILKAIKGQRCMTLSNDPTISCSGVVDYLFYLSPSSTLTSLNAASTSHLNDTKFAILLPNTCQEAYKKVICASVYLKCQPGINLNDKV